MHSYIGIAGGAARGSSEEAVVPFSHRSPCIPLQVEPLLLPGAMALLHQVGSLH